MKINNKEVFKNIQTYLNLDIYGKKVICPYSINFVENEFLGLMRTVGVDEEKVKGVHELYKNNETTYGWYRGKGTVKEISSATKEIAKRRNFSLESASPEGIVEFMRLVGLGVDCSGYVFNILLESVEDRDVFLKSLNWIDEKMVASRAGVDIFCGMVSEVVDINDLKSLDLMVVKSRYTGKNSHIAILIENEGKMYISQSSISTAPSGVRLDSFEVKDSKPVFSFKYELGTSIQDMYDMGLVEFRRLKYSEL